MKILGVIPARYQSSRFPGKPLVDVCGKLLLERVYLQAKKVVEFSDVYVATDDERIYSACMERSINVVMTSRKHQTGTDRVGEVAEKNPADLYVNIQGDEPLIEPETIRAAITPFINADPATRNDVQVTNLMTRIKDPVDLINVTVPKVIASREGHGVYLTRSAAPFPKGNLDAHYYKQVCVYGFTPKALRFFCNSPRGAVESIEDIEILRYIEAGIHVQFIEVASQTIAVDSPNDLRRVIDWLQRNERPSGV